MRLVSSKRPFMLQCSLYASWRMTIDPLVGRRLPPTAHASWWFFETVAEAPLYMCWSSCTIILCVTWYSISWTSKLSRGGDEWYPNVTSWCTYASFGGPYGPMSRGCDGGNCLLSISLRVLAVGVMEKGSTVLLGLTSGKSNWIVVWIYSEMPRLEQTPLRTHTGLQ